jgi:hypothetical protein
MKWVAVYKLWFCKEINAHEAEIGNSIAFRAFAISVRILSRTVALWQVSFKPCESGKDFAASI